MVMSDKPGHASKPLVTGVRGGLTLGVFAMLGAGLVAVTYQYTHERIAKNEQDRLLRSMREVLPSMEYDNDVLEDTVLVEAPGIGDADDMVTVYRARKAGLPVAVVMKVTAPDGYSGAIRLLVGIDTDGKLTGVRVVTHRETPGLGDGIDIARSQWISGFDGKSLDSPPLESWAVKRDGGEFDQFTGATITPRAVVNAVRNALLYFRAHKAALVAAKENQ